MKVHAVEVVIVEEDDLSSLGTTSLTYCSFQLCLLAWCWFLSWCKGSSAGGSVMYDTAAVDGDSSPLLW